MKNLVGECATWLRRTALMLAIALVLPACESTTRSASVVLITLDTLRADHLTCYGYGRETSPRIDAFARRSTRFANAYATAPWTVPAHASIFTGLFPFEHGARTVKVTADAAENVAPLSGDHSTLAEVFRDAGYQTAAFVANSGYLLPRFGFDQGFETYIVKRQYGQQLNSSIFDWLRKNAKKPFFLFLNYIDTHRPYNISPRQGTLPAPSRESPGQLLDLLYHHVMGSSAEAPSSLVHAVIDQYDTAIANVDRSIGELFDFLAQHDLFDDTMIILTSDHGEYFGEHHLVEHSKDVYEQALRVPLIIKLPNQQVATLDERPVSAVDLPRLILDQLPAEIADRAWRVFPYRVGNHPIIAENYFSRLKDLRHPVWGARFDRVRAAFYSDQYKYIRSSDGQHELYDLAQDPAERSNLIAHRPEVARRLARELEGFQHNGFAPPGEPVKTLPEEALEQLRALGYQ